MEQKRRKPRSRNKNTSNSNSLWILSNHLELFDSESKKLQDALESIQKKSDKTIPEIIDVYYQVIKVDSLAKVLKENFQMKPEYEWHC